MISDSRCLGKTYSDGDVICHQGELANCMYLVQKGQAEIIVRAGSREFCLGVLEAGDFFGEAELLEHGVRRATLRAVGTATVISVHKRTFLHQLHEDSSFAVKIVREMARHIQRLEQALMRSADLAAFDAISTADQEGCKRPG